MEKEFKLKPGDGVWLMYDNKPVFGFITKAWYKKYTDNIDLKSPKEVEKYYVKVSGKEIHNTFELNELFPDKQSLIESL